MKTRKRSRSAVSDIIATLILIAITVAIGVTLLSAATGAFAIGSSNQLNQSGNIAQRIQERIVIYDAWFYTVSSTQYLSLKVYNYGLVTVTLSQLYINQSSSTPSEVAAFNTRYPQGDLISPGYSGNITIPFTYSATSEYSITLASSAGSTFQTYWIG